MGADFTEEVTFESEILLVAKRRRGYGLVCGRGYPGRGTSTGKGTKVHS